LSLFDHLNPPKTIENEVFSRTDRQMAAQTDFRPHGRKVGSHGAIHCPHGLNFYRTNGKMAAQNEFCPHGVKIVPHKPILRLREAIFRRTESFTPAA